ncbi:MAG: exopolysaccharide biosynthesis polyprenyl glycosylphosphotransferase [Ilumatobacteraceae bacterium]
MTELTETRDPEVNQPFPAAIERIVGRAHRPLDWLWAHGFRFLFVLDAMVLFGSMVAINLVRFGTSWPTYPLSHYWIGFSIATLIHVGVNYFAGLYEREPRLGYRPWLPRVFMAVAIGVGTQGVAYVALDRYLMPRLNLAAFLVVGSIVLTANRGVSRNLANRRRGPSRVILVGSNQSILRSTYHLRLSEHDAKVVASSESTGGLFDLVRKTDATDILLLDLAAFESAFPEPLTALDHEGVGVHQRVSAHETLLGLQSVRQIAGMPFTRMRTHAVASHQLRLKRWFDVLVVVVTAPVTVPVVGLLALYVRLRAGSPVLFRQRRVGLAGSHFTVVKFRTMRLNAEPDGPRLATRDDDRVARGLGWMRSTRADELPQLWNVLKGDMSLVGPRPERPELVRDIEREVPGYGRRHELPPGMTGMAQVYGRYETSPEHKLGYDLQYLVNWSIILDVQILLRTVWVVLSRRG